MPTRFRGILTVLTLSTITVRCAVSGPFAAGPSPAERTGESAARPVQATSREPRYKIAFTSFAPRNQQLFLADASGNNATPLAAIGSFDSNASFSFDGKWIVFTSTRTGSSDLFRIRIDGSGLQQLTDHPAFDDQAVFSPDGHSIAFVSSRDGQADIWTLNLKTQELVNVTRHPEGDFRPAWSPDGHWIAFSTDRDSQRAVRGAPAGLAFVVQQTTEIYVVHPDGSGLRRITDANAIAGSPAWTRDGSAILFYEADLQQRLQRGQGTTQIVSVDVKSGERRALTSGEGIKLSPQALPDGRVGYVARSLGGTSFAQNASGTSTHEGWIAFTSGDNGASGAFDKPSWSPDGRRMVFHRTTVAEPISVTEWFSPDSRFGLVRVGLSFPSFSPDGTRVAGHENTLTAKRVVVTDADGANRTVVYEVTNDKPCPSEGGDCPSAARPFWSPRGTHIAFSFGAHLTARGTARLLLIRPDGTGLKTLTNGEANDALPSWSPDGVRLVFRRAAPERTGIRIVDVETGAITALDTGSDYDTFPTWSPSGDLISFTSKRDGDYEIYVIRPDGTGLHRLTTARGHDAHSDWSPDGEWIAFSTSRQGFKDEYALHPGNLQPYGEIAVMRKDGTDFRMLTDNPWEDGAVSWIPVNR
jgi:Tol biopolymer transport system component